MVRLRVPVTRADGHHDGRDPSEWAASERDALHSESPALVIGQPESATAKLVPQDAVLLEQVVDGRGLLAVNPASDGGQQEAEGLEGRHGG